MAASLATAVLAKINGAAAAAAHAPQDYNGAIAAVDLAHAQQSIDPKNVVVVSAAGQFDVQASIAMALHVRMPALVVGTPRAVSADMISAATSRVRSLVAVHKLLSVVSHCVKADALGSAILDAAGAHAKIRMIFRATDTMRRDAAIALPDFAVCMEAADYLWEVLTDGSASASEVVSSAHFVTLALMANAMHRSQLEGHNWYTSKTRDKKSQTSKYIAIAAEHAEEFAAMMVDEGHDLLHFLSDATLTDIADAISGEVGYIFTPGAAYLYGGEDVQGCALPVVLAIGDAVKDRYPAGMLGAAKAHVGLEMARAMFTSISAKVSSPVIRDMVVAIAALQARLNKGNMPRKQLLEFIAAIGPLICAAYGYAAADAIAFALAPAHPAIAKYANSRMADKAVGAVLFNAVDRLEADHDSTAALFETTLASLAVALRVACSVEVGGAAILDIPAFSSGRVHIAVPRAEIAAERAARQVEAMFARGAGAAPLAITGGTGPYIEELGDDGELFQGRGEAGGKLGKGRGRGKGVKPGPREQVALPVPKVKATGTVDADDKPVFVPVGGGGGGGAAEDFDFAGGADAKDKGGDY